MYEQCCQQYMSFLTFYSCDDSELLRFLIFYALVTCVYVFGLFGILSIRTVEQ